MLYVYRREASDSARELANAVEGLRWRGSRVPMNRKARAGDIVICWGEALPDINGVRILNGAPIRNKFQDAEVLAAAGVPTIQVSAQRPVVQRNPAANAADDPAVVLFQRAKDATEEFLETDFTRNSPVYRDAVRDLAALLTEFNGALRAPIPAAVAARPMEEWLGRLRNHVGGNDLLNAPANPEYFVKKEAIVAEYRIHSFKGQSIRAGKKDPRADFQNPHPWIRSWDGGWRILYDGVSAKQRHRDVAHAAIRALGLDFGAVDVAERADKSVFVLEVNRAPGLSDGTAAVYARAIQRWAGNRE